MSISELQKHKVKLLDAWRESLAEYGYQQAVKDGYYKTILSDSANGFSPTDPWLSTNLCNCYNMTEKRENELFGK
nr:MAG TPA: hypothetical protein [Caudoviricetes sp.]